MADESPKGVDPGILDQLARTARESHLGRKSPMGDKTQLRRRPCYIGHFLSYRSWFAS